MVTRLLYESPVLALSHDEASDWLYLEWYGTPTLKQVQEGCALIGQALHEESTQKVLCDISQVLQPNQEAVRWALTEWLPAVRNMGLRYVAWVYSQHYIIGRETFDRLHVLLTSPVVAAFDDLASAYDWLQQQA
ncbi:hypothetical protein [Solirubrum puertoriconensis]|uniref:STAS/SEC14 domain-containing protein n=1 Tax=Solirubrum puertoriconensis TaxID=1751427 RepID=A0A9X0L4Z4_SOLP1|nr:hypothetical protein [Solirubrum puertoriconensis]KUG08163.1 hypothetical protein ASU33_08190 [Solirubrum puertoriconensis]